MVDESPTSAPASSATYGKVSLPERTRSPWWELRPATAGRDRASWSAPSCWSTSTATATATATTRTATSVGLVDSIYYTTVTLSTTGYGDIAPYTDQARLINAFVITPLRIAFLVLLIGTTLEVLASQGRDMFRVARWRKNMGKHVVVVGYGTKGRSAVETLVGNGQSRESIVIVDPSRDRPGRCALRRTDRRHRRRHASYRAAPGRRRDRHPGHHHHRPRRLQRARHPDRAPAQPGRLDRRVRARVGERAADATVRRRLGDHLLRRRRPPPRVCRRSPRRSAR